MKGETHLAIAMFEAVEPRSVVEELFAGNGEFRLSETDVRFLLSLLDHNFLTARHVDVFNSPRYARNRIGRLFKEGLIARAKVPEAPAKFSRGRTWEYAYGLTSAGFECLLFNRDDTALRLKERWTPPFRSGGGSGGLIHQIHLADLCVSVEDYIGSEALGLSWVGTGHVEIRVPGQPGKRQPLVVRPDAVFYATTSNRLFVEHQRMLDTRKVTDHLDDYSAFFMCRAWPEWERPPVVLFSVSDIDQHRWREPVERVRQLAAARRALFGRFFIVRESDWRQGQWTVVDADPRANEVNLFDVTARPFLDPGYPYRR